MKTQTRNTSNMSFLGAGGAGAGAGAGEEDFDLTGKTSETNLLGGAGPKAGDKRPADNMQARIERKNVTASSASKVSKKFKADEAGAVRVAGSTDVAAVMEGLEDRDRRIVNQFWKDYTDEPIWSVRLDSPACLQRCIKNLTSLFRAGMPLMLKQESKDGCTHTVLSIESQTGCGGMKVDFKLAVTPCAMKEGEEFPILSENERLIYPEKPEHNDPELPAWMEKYGAIYNSADRKIMWISSKILQSTVKDLVKGLPVELGYTQDARLRFRSVHRSGIATGESTTIGTIDQGKNQLPFVYEPLPCHLRVIVDCAQFQAFIGRVHTTLDAKELEISISMTKGADAAGGAFTDIFVVLNGRSDKGSVNRVVCNRQREAADGELMIQVVDVTMEELKAKKPTPLLRAVFHSHFMYYATAGLKIDQFYINLLGGDAGTMLSLDIPLGDGISGLEYWIAPKEED